MSEKDGRLKLALTQAVSMTMENMAFEQAELMEEGGAALNEYKDDATSSRDLQDYYEQVIAENSAVTEGDDETTDSDQCAENKEEEAEADTGSAEEGEDTALWASILIMKPLRGEMVLAFSSAYAKQLTETIYGDMGAGETPDIAVHDAIAEIINTVAGRFLERLLPSDREFELGLPNTGWSDPPDVENEVIRLDFNLGGRTVTAIVGGEDFDSLEQKIGEIQEKVS